MRPFRTRPSVARALLAAIVLLFIAALPAMAHASPPDPSWVPGIYDDADFDNVVAILTSAAASVDTSTPADLTPPQGLIDRVPALNDPVPLTGSVPPAHPRAPPAP